MWKFKILLCSICIKRFWLNIIYESSIKRNKVVGLGFISFFFFDLKFFFNVNKGKERCVDFGFYVECGRVDYDKYIIIKCYLFLFYGLFLCLIGNRVEVEGCLCE